MCYIVRENGGNVCRPTLRWNVPLNAAYRIPAYAIVGGRRSVYDGSEGRGYTHLRRQPSRQRSGDRQ